MKLSIDLTANGWVCLFLIEQNFRQKVVESIKIYESLLEHTTTLFSPSQFLTLLPENVCCLICQKQKTLTFW
jgi:hypothetical protein